MLTTGAAANGGSCVARHEGRVVFVRYAPTGRWCGPASPGTADPIGMPRLFEIIEPSSPTGSTTVPDRRVDGAGCCDLAFADPATRRIKATRWWQTSWPPRGFMGRGQAEPVGSGAVGAGAPGCAGRRRRRPARFATTAPTGDRPALRSCPPAWTTAGIETAGRAQNVHAVLDDDGRTGTSSRPPAGRGRRVGGGPARRGARCNGSVSRCGAFGDGVPGSVPP